MARPAGAFPSGLATRGRAALLALVSLSCVFSVVLSLVVFANPWPARVHLSWDAGLPSGLPVAASDRVGRVTALGYQGESLVASARSPGASCSAPERLGSSGGIARGGGEPSGALSVMAHDSILAACQAMTPGACMDGNVWAVSSADARQVAISKGVAGAFGFGAFFTAVASLARHSSGRAMARREGKAPRPPGPRA